MRTTKVVDNSKQMTHLLYCTYRFGGVIDMYVEQCLWNLNGKDDAKDLRTNLL